MDSTATATFRLASGGKIRFQTQSGGGFVEQWPCDEWLEPESTETAALYEALAQPVAGQLSSGSVNQWLPLTTARDWGLTRSAVGTSEAVIRVSLRRIGTSTLLASTDVTLRATVNGGTAPPASAPTLSVPGTAYINESYQVSWGTVSGATSYQLEESYDYGGWYGLYSGGGTSTYRTVSWTGSYGYRVRACNSAGCGPTSATQYTSVSCPWWNPCNPNSRDPDETMDGQAEGDAR